MKKLIITNDLFKNSPDFFKSLGVSVILSDLDNTLAGYSDFEPEGEVLKWIHSLLDAGLLFCIVSNAKEERVAKFCKPLGLPYVSSAGKPRGTQLLQVLAKYGKSSNDAIMLGDQYFTDYLAGRNAGIPVMLVPPKVKGFLFSLRRAIETPFIKFSQR